MENTCCTRLKHRDGAEKRALINRLSRIEGQIRGLRAMVEKDAYCPDILTQASAATSALNSFARALLAEHIRTCVVQDIQKGDEDAAEALIATINQIIK